MYIHPASLNFSEPLLTILEDILQDIDELPPRKILKLIAHLHKTNVKLINWWFKSQLALRKDYQKQIQNLEVQSFSQKRRKLSHFEPITKIYMKIYN